METHSPSLDDLKSEAFASILTAAATRLRSATTACLITTGIALLAYLSQGPGDWLNARLDLVHAAIREQVWANGSRPHGNPGEAAAAWARQRGFTSKEELVQYANTLEGIRLERTIQSELQVLGTTLSVDSIEIGALCCGAIAVLMLVMHDAYLRYHHVLYLALWRIHGIARAEAHGPASKANNLYHVLALEQTLDTPPTMARFGLGIGSRLRGVLIILPVWVEGLFIQQDVAALPVLMSLSPRRAALLVILEVLAFALTLFSAVACLLYDRSNAWRWRRTFFYLNPSLLTKRPPGWLTWVRVVRTKKEDS